MTDKQFQYYLLEEDGRSLTVQNGVVTATSVKTPLTNTPDGWQDQSIAWERDMIKTGLVNNATAPFGFVRDAAKILRKIIWTQSFERKIFLLILKWTIEFNTIIGYYKDYYKYFYKAELDLSKVKDEDHIVTIPLLEQGISQKLKANENTTYEIPFDKDSIWVKMDGVELTFKKSYLCPAQDLSCESSWPSNPDKKNNYVLGFNEIASEGTTVNVASLSITDTTFPAPYDLSTADGWFIKVTGETEITAKLKFRFLLSNGPLGLSGSFRFRLVNSNGSQIHVFADQTFDTSIYSQIFEFDSEITFTMQAGEKAFLLIEMESQSSLLHGGPHIITVHFYETICQFDYKSRYRTTYVRAFQPMTMFRKLIEKITGSPLNCASTLLEENSNLCITCGDAIRGINGARVKISLDQFFQTYRTQLAAGMGIEAGLCTIDTFAHFLTVDNPLVLGGAKDFVATFAVDLMANTAKIGYLEKQIDDVNGKYSFHNAILYGSPVTRVVKELDIICPAAACPYYIEITRANLEGKVTTDNLADNDLMIVDTKSQGISYTFDYEAFGSPDKGFAFTGSLEIIDILKPGDTFSVVGTALNDGTYNIESIVAGIGGFQVFTIQPTQAESGTNVTVITDVYELFREDYDDFEGVPQVTSLFNIRLSPARLTEKHKPWLNSVFFQQAGLNLKFLSTEKNRTFKTVKGSVTVDEDADVTIGTQRLFKPVYFDFENEVPADLVETLESNPNRGFTTSWYGHNLTGILLKAALAPNTLEEQSYKLLCGPDEDLSKLL
jgi:hypothetical protein